MLGAPITHGISGGDSIGRSTVSMGAAQANAKGKSECKCDRNDSAADSGSLRADHPPRPGVHRSNDNPRARGWWVGDSACGGEGHGYRRTEAPWEIVAREVARPHRVALLPNAMSQVERRVHNQVVMGGRRSGDRFGSGQLGGRRSHQHGAASFELLSSDATRHTKAMDTWNMDEDEDTNY